MSVQFRVLDMARTATNVTGDSAVTVLIDAAEQKWAEDNAVAPAEIGQS